MDKTREELKHDILMCLHSATYKVELGLNDVAEAPLAEAYQKIQRLNRM